MKAPDKIYLNKYMIRPGMLYPANPPADTPEFEYIRKDALMKWIDEKQNSLELHDEYEAGKYDALQETIDKLESM